MNRIQVQINEAKVHHKKFIESYFFSRISELNSQEKRKHMELDLTWVTLRYLQIVYAFFLHFR